MKIALLPQQHFIVCSIRSLQTLLDRTQTSDLEICIFWPSCIFIESLLVHNPQKVFSTLHYSTSDKIRFSTQNNKEIRSLHSWGKIPCLNSNYNKKIQKFLEGMSEGESFVIFPSYEEITINASVFVNNIFASLNQGLTLQDNSCCHFWNNNSRTTKCEKSNQLIYQRWG